MSLKSGGGDDIDDVAAIASQELLDGLLSAEEGALGIDIEADVEISANEILKSASVFFAAHHRR